MQTKEKSVSRPEVKHSDVRVVYGSYYLFLLFPKREIHENVIRNLEVFRKFVFCLSFVGRRHMWSGGRIRTLINYGKKK